ncbi:hypothetical protein HI850_009035 [bacterium SPL81]|nr:hypothetical protein [Acinetobacter baumannii]
MAFDLVQYFSEQIKIQKPQLFNKYSTKEKINFIDEVNVLSLGQLISLWKQNPQKLYQEIKASDPLYVQEIARHLTTSKSNQSKLSATELESSISEVITLQFTELNQLDQTGSFGQTGMGELLIGQIEHLSGQAEDWVWYTNQLIELIGSKLIEQPETSLEDTMQEFNQLVHQQAQPLQHATDHDHQQIITPPSWSYIFSPIIALVILIFLYCSYSQLIAG